MNAQDIVNTLSQIDYRNPISWPFWLKATAVLSTFIGIAVGGMSFVVTPMRAELETYRAEELELRSKFEVSQVKVAKLDALKKQLGEMEKRFSEMLAQLPSKAEVAALLNDISQARVVASLEEELFQPLPELVRDFYAEVPNKIIVTGGYHEMGDFVAAVAALPRIVTLEDIEIRSKETKLTANPVPGQLRMSALAKTYRYLDDAEMAKAAEALNPKGKAAGKKKP